MEKIEKLKEIINNSNNIVAFTGAGVSTLSGIKDFRGKNGLYKEKFEHSAEYYLSSRCFFLEPNTFYKFYKSNMNVLDKEPNIVHKYLTKLEKNGKLKAVVTQNIDGLDKKSDTKNVLEIHGTIYKNYCAKCGKEYSAEYIFNSEGVPYCDCKGIIKPYVVLYGEMLNDDFEKAIYYINNADTLIVLGSSLTVEPAASLVRNFSGNNLIIINENDTPLDEYATLVIHENLENVISKLNV